MGDLVLDLDLDLRIRNVYVVGNHRTRDQVIENQFKDALEASTLRGVLSGLKAGTENLRSLDIFSTINVKLEAVDDSEDETDVTLQLQEKGWITTQFGVNVNDQEQPAAEGTITLRNRFGYGERINGGWSSSPLRGHQDKFIRMVRRRVMGTGIDVELEGKIAMIDMEQRSSCTETLHGVRAQAFTYSEGGDARHRLTWEVCHRDTEPIRHSQIPHAFTASPSIIAESRPSVKGSVAYTYTGDGRDDPIMPTAGSFFEGSVEGAGVVGDVRFLKGTVEAQKHLPIWRGLSLGLCGFMGAVRPLGGNQRVRFNDRFFLGGPCTLRGFQSSGVGPRAPREEGENPNGDALGGDVTYRASAILGVPFPLLSFPAQSLPAHLHIFANVGNLTAWETPIGRYFKDTRLSVGVGTVWNALGMCRMEVNLAHVIRKAQNDLTRSFQVGFDFDFR
ncbi:unnamed protein product [Discosporangium mesarthrocarpum]